MKTMKISVILLLATFTLAYCQPDKTFTEVVTFEKGFRFNVSGDIQLLPYLGGSGGVVNWTDVLNKPLVFAPDLSITNPLYKPIGYVPSWAEITGKPSLFSGSYLDLTNKPSLFSGSYLDLTDKPGEIELSEAIVQIKVLFQVLTQAQINILTPIKGQIVINSTDNALQWYDGTQWHTFATTN